jgi:hypothetical protein
MRARLLDLCLLAYPRARRASDRDFLRDLALDLAETQGLLRQAWSLLGGGLRERIELRRRRPGAGRGPWVRRIVVASLVLSVLAAMANGLTSSERGAREVEQFACQYTREPPPRSAHLPTKRGAGCGDAARLVAARKRAGWDCATGRRARSNGLTTTWRCTRG